MCHASYNWTEAKFDFTNQNNIDCVVCHDRTGTYYKMPPGKGNPACSTMFEGLKPFDLAKVAQSAGKPERENCGGCHFNGGGGDGVKHGDLNSSLINPPRGLDVHMATKERISLARNAICPSSTSLRAAATRCTPRTWRAPACRACAVTSPPASPATVLPRTR